MKCNNCESTNVRIDYQTIIKSKSRSFLWNLFMFILTGGLWLIWMIIRKKKEQTITTKFAICQDCGNVEILDRKIK